MIALALIGHPLPVLPMVVWLWGLLLLSELGRFVVAYLTGGTIYEILAGTGPVLRTFRRAGINWEIRCFPFGLRVVPLVEEEAWFRVRTSLPILAAHAPGAAALWLIVTGSLPWIAGMSWSLDESRMDWMIGTGCFAAMRVVLPYPSRGPRRITAKNDLEALLGVWFMPGWACRMLAYAHRAAVLAAAGDEKGSAYWSAEALQVNHAVVVRHGVDPLALVDAAFGSGDLDTAFARAQAIADDVANSGELRSRALDLMASAILFEPALSHRRGEALVWIDRAIELMPLALTLQGTKGSLLAEEGRPNEARAMLERVGAATHEPFDAALCHAYLLLIAAQKPAPESIPALLAEAQSTVNENPRVAAVLARVRALLRYALDRHSSSQ